MSIIISVAELFKLFSKHVIVEYRLAVESLLEDARRGKTRAERVGTMGW